MGFIEPSADIRQAAKVVREVYVALLAEGFTKAQALNLVGQMMRSGSEQ